MKVKQLKEFLAKRNDADEVLIWGWFANGERYYAPNLPLTISRAETESGTTGLVIGSFDDCLAHRRKIRRML